MVSPSAHWTVHRLRRTGCELDRHAGAPRRHPSPRALHTRRRIAALLLVQLACTLPVPNALASTDTVVLCSEQGSLPVMTRRLREAIMAQLASISVTVRVVRTPTQPPETSEARLALAEQLAERHPGDELAVFWVSGHDAQDARLHIVDLRHRRVETRTLATTPESRSAAAAAAGIIAREAALAIRRSPKVRTHSARRSAGRDEQNTDADRRRVDAGEAPSATGTTTGRLDQDSPQAIRAGGPAGTSAEPTGAAQPPLTAESPEQTADGTAPETGDPHEPGVAEDPTSASAPHPLVDKPAASSAASVPPDDPGGSLLLGIGFHMDTAADAIGWQSGVALGAQYKFPPDWPLFVAFESSVIPTVQTGEAPLQIRVKRWPVAALAGVHVALNSSVHVQAGVGAMLEIWQRETVEAPNVSSSSPESEQLRYGGLLHAELRLPLNPFTELMAAAELALFVNKIEYLGDDGARFTVLRSYTASPRAVIGACLRIP